MRITTRSSMSVKPFSSFWIRSRSFRIFVSSVRRGLVVK
jgi:hypothetical protein